MLPVIALSLALLAPQSTAPATSPVTQPPANQPSSNPSTPHKSAGDVNTPGVRRVGGGVSAPRVIYQVDPEFTREARKTKMSGMTLVNLIVDANGNPENVHVARSMADTVDKKHRKAALTLDEKAVDAVKKYRFAPAIEGGKPVAVELNVEVNFQIF